jgi:hypothetical protein
MAHILTEFGAEELFNNDPVGEEIKIEGTSFFRGEHCNIAPVPGDHAWPAFIENFVMKGLKPEGRPVDRTTRVTAFGSCFAENIGNHLGSLGFDTTKSRNPEIYISVLGEGLVNVHALCQQLEWALENAAIPQNLWHGYKAEDYGFHEHIRLGTEQAFRGTEFFIITLGLSEVWYDEPTGGVFWRAVPRRHYDPARHKFRVCSFAETKAQLERMYGLIRKHVPQAKVLFTLSPIPLAATFRPMAALVASSASKAILRAALDEFQREHEDELNKRLFYFPAYEIVNELFYEKFFDGRHPTPEILGVVLKLFEATYCNTDVSMDEVSALYREARAQNAAAIRGSTP